MAVFPSYSNVKIQHNEPSSINISEIANSQTWKTLIHFYNGKLRITDERFILSNNTSNVFSLENELKLTIELFKQPNNDGLCRFPARNLFLSANGILDKATPEDYKKCKKFYNYKIKVPFDKLKLVYASEVLSSASSMMGHVFLKAEGINNNDNFVNHSISFFTQYDSFNPFKLVYDGLYGGMEGFFIVRKYEKDLKNYLIQEQRNVFEYEINYDGFSKKLIKFHIWELKDIDIGYLFQSYNCATLTQNILSLGNEKLNDNLSLFITPKDVVKSMYNAKNIGEQKVNLSHKWKIAFLEQELGSEIVDSVITELNTTQNFHDLLLNIPLSKRELVIEYLESILLRNSTDTVKKSFLLSKLNRYKNLNNKIFIDFNQHNNPINSLSDSIFTTSYIYENKVGNHTVSRYVDFSYLPASHLLRSDNKEFLSESELKIGETKIRINLDNGNAELRELTLYSVTSLVPNRKIKSELSGYFNFGYKHTYDNLLRDDGYVFIEAGLGKTIKIHRDIMAYGIINTGLGVRKNNTKLNFQPKIGAIFKIIGNLKVNLEASHEFNNNISSIIRKEKFSIVWNRYKTMSLSADFEKISLGIKKSKNISFNLDYYF